MLILLLLPLNMVPVFIQQITISVAFNRCAGRIRLIKKEENDLNNLADIKRSKVI
jgi:hypothetical protein